MARQLTTGLYLGDGVAEWATVATPLPREGGALPGPQGRYAVDREQAQDEQARRDQLASVLRAQLRVGHSISVGLPSDQLLLKVIDLPPASDEELAGMVSLQIDKFSPFPVETIVVSHEVLARTDQAVSVLVAATQNRHMDALAGLLAAAGLKSSRVDAGVLGWCRVLRDSGLAGDEGTHVAIVFAQERPDLMVWSRGVLQVVRSLPGPDSMAAAEYAMEIAKEVGFTLVTLELERGVGGPVKILILSDDDRGVSLAGVLKGEFGEACQLKPFSAVAGVAEGLARRGREPGLDLTPASWRHVRLEASFRRKLIASGTAALGVWLVLALILFGGLYWQKLHLKRLTQEAKQISAQSMDVRNLRRRVTTIHRYLDRSDSALECLREVSGMMPPEVELTSYSYKKGEALRISGQSTAVAAVYDFKKKLDGSPIFKGVSLEGPRESAGRQVFDLVLRLGEGGT